MTRVVVLTGAGISAESGLETFRAEDGLWARHRIKDVCTPEALARDPALVHGFYNARRAQLAHVAPNAAHRALAAFAAARGDEVLTITQNVDDLHERAGHTGLLHLHGELLSLRCGACAYRAPFAGASHRAMGCPDCGLGRLRPDIVFFGEMPYQLDRVYSALERAEVFVAIGTSGNVYPAAGFAEVARRAGAQTWLLNLDMPDNQRAFTALYPGRASVEIDRMLADLARLLDGGDAAHRAEGGAGS